MRSVQHNTIEIEQGPLLSPHLYTVFMGGPEINLHPFSPQSSRTIWKWNFCGNHVWTAKDCHGRAGLCAITWIQRQDETFEDVPAGSGSSLPRSRRKTKTCWEGWQSPWKHQTLPSMSLALMSSSFESLEEILFFLATISRFSVEYWCVSSFLNASVSNCGSHTDRSSAENRSSLSHQRHTRVEAG